MRELVGVNPKLAFIVQEAIKITKQDFGILHLGGLRTDEEQRRLYAQGRSIEGNKVTWTLNSRHQSGNATDMVAFVNGKPSWSEKYYHEIAKAVKKVIKKHNIKGIDWGYDIFGRDYAHWQISNTNYDIRKYT